jgi:site-specific DNA-cytosine methylase
MHKNIKMIGLLAGAGGMTIGFLERGFRSVLAVENDITATGACGTNVGGTTRVHFLHPTGWLRSTSHQDRMITPG